MQPTAAAETAEDKLGWAMTFLRAAEQGRIGTMLKCQAAYPHLATLCGAPHAELRLSPCMRQLSCSRVGECKSFAGHHSPDLRRGEHDEWQEGKTAKTFNNLEN